MISRHYLVGKRMASAKNIKGITIEIEGKTSGLVKSLDDANKALSKTKSALSEVNSALKLDPGNTELITQKQKLLADAIDETKKKLEAERQAAADAAEALERGDITQEQYATLQAEVAKTTKELEALEAEAKEAGNTLGKSFEDAGGKISAAGDKIKAFGDGMSDIGTKLMPVSAAIAGVAGASVKAATDFEDAIAKLNTIADTSKETGVPIEELQEQIMALSDETGIAATEIADNVYNAISAGQKTGDAVNFVSKATKLAAAGFADSASALDVLTTIMNAYGMEADKVSHVSDVLINTQNLGKTTVAELASSMGKIIPTANAAGVSLENIASGYAIMTANGIATAETTTYMNSMLNELSKSGTKSSEALKNTAGKSFQELMADGNSLADVLAILQQAADESGVSMADMFGSAEAGKAALTMLSGGVENFNSTLASMNNSTGATDSAFAKLDTTSRQAKIALNEIKNTGIELGQAILTEVMPLFRQVTDGIKSVTDWFKNLSDDQKQMIVKIGAVIAAIGPALVIIGKVVAAVGTIVSAFGTVSTFIGGTLIPAITSVGAIITGTIMPAIAGVLAALAPFLPIIAAVAAAIAAVIVVIKNWDAIVEMFQIIWQNFVEWVKGVADIFRQIGEGIALAWQEMVTKLQEFFAPIVEFFSPILEALQYLFETVVTAIQILVQRGIDFISEKVSSGISAVKEFLTNILNSIVEFVGPILESIATKVSDALNKVQEFFTNIWNAVYTFVSGVVTNIKETVSAAFLALYEKIREPLQKAHDTVVEIFDKIKEKIHSVIENAKTWGHDLIMNFVQGIKDKISAVGDAIRGVADKIKDLIGFSEPSEGPLHNFHTFAPDLMDLFAKGINDNMGTVTGAMTNMAASVKNALSTGADMAIGRLADSITGTNEAQLAIAGAGGDTVIPVYIGSEKIDEVVVKATQRANYRSGGR